MSSYDNIMVDAVVDSMVDALEDTMVDAMVDTMEGTMINTMVDTMVDVPMLKFPMLKNKTDDVYSYGATFDLVVIACRNLLQIDRCIGS